MPKPKFTDDEIRQAMRVQAWALTVNLEAMITPLVTGVRALATSQNDRDLARFLVESLFDEVIERFSEAKAVLVAEFSVPGELADADRRDGDV